MDERTATKRKIQCPLLAQSEVCSRTKRNKWRGPSAQRRAQAVYAGIAVEPSRRPWAWEWVVFMSLLGAKIGTQEKLGVAGSWLLNSDS
jgi:hypothetical protein